MLGAPGGAGGGANAVAGILQMICSCLAPPAANQQQQQPQYGAASAAPASGTPANANTAPGSTYATGHTPGVRLIWADALSG